MPIYNKFGYDYLIRRQNLLSRFSAKIEEIKNGFRFVVANIVRAFKRKINRASQLAFDY